MMAHVNTRGTHIPISIQGNHPALTTTQLEREIFGVDFQGSFMTFWGNIFSASPSINACVGQYNISGYMAYTLEKGVAAHYGRDCIFPGVCAAFAIPDAGCALRPTYKWDYKSTSITDPIARSPTDPWTSYTSYVQGTNRWDHLIHVGVPNWFVFTALGSLGSVSATGVPCTSCEKGLAATIPKDISFYLALTQNVSRPFNTMTGSTSLMTSTNAPLRLVVHYSNGTTQTMSLVFKLGSTTTRVSFPPTGTWENYATIGVPITSVANEKMTVTIANEATVSPRLDYGYVTVP